MFWCVRHDWSRLNRTVHRATVYKFCQILQQDCRGLTYVATMTCLSSTTGSSTVRQSNCLWYCYSWHRGIVLAVLTAIVLQLGSELASSALFVSERWVLSSWGVHDMLGVLTQQLKWVSCIATKSAVLDVTPTWHQAFEIQSLVTFVICYKVEGQTSLSINDMDTIAERQQWYMCASPCGKAVMTCASNHLVMRTTSGQPGNRQPLSVHVT